MIWGTPISGNPHDISENVADGHITGKVRGCHPISQPRPDILRFVRGVSDHVVMWWFPEIGVPPNHLFE